MAKILVIEDEAFIGNNLQEVLSFEGHDVTHVLNGLEGVQYIQKHLPDLILCDVMMPEMDGYEVLTHIHSTPETASIPFVFLTALADQDAVEKGKEMGADAYIRKPFSFQELLTTVTVTLGKRGEGNRSD